MLEEEAVVVAVESGSVWVETCRQSACNTCTAKSHCGHSLLNKISNKGRVQRLQIQTERHLSVGDAVVLGLSEGAFVRGSLLVYLVPLIGLLAGAVIGESLWGADSAPSLIAAAAGLAGGFAFVRRYSHRYVKNSDYQPVILRKRSVSGDIPVAEHP